MRIAGAAALALGVAAGEAGACSCNGGMSSDAYIAGGYQIARGTVVSACREDPGNRFGGSLRFRIEVQWAENFDPPPIVTLLSSGDEGICGLTYFIGEIALFNLFGAGPVYTSQLCSEPGGARAWRASDPRPIRKDDPDLADCAD